MLNRLPEKLTQLRKHFTYSQQDVADLCQVDVMEYISWENGRKIPHFLYLKKLSEIYQISLDELVSNQTEITLLNQPVEDFDIPFMNDRKVDETLIFRALYDHTLDEIEVEEEIGKTRVVPVQKIAKVQTSTVKSDGKAEQPVNNKSDKKNPPLTKQPWFWGVSVAVLAILCLGIFLLWPKPAAELPNEPVELELTTLNRITAGETLTLIINEDGTVTSYGSLSGDNIRIDQWKDIVSLSIGTSHVVGLRQDGTVIALGLDRYGQSSVALWQDITQISAGANHTVGLKSDQTVICAGDNGAGQCQVEEWQNIQSVMAYQNSTLAITEEGTLLWTGEELEIEALWQEWTDLSAVVMGDHHVAALTTKGDVYCMAEEGSLVCKGVEQWSNVIQLTAYGDNLAALTASGSVFANGSNAYHQTETEQINNAAAIALGRNYLVALTRENTIHGIGDNQYGVYPITIQNETPHLANVTNITVEIDTMVRLHWDAVEGAAYYEVTIDGVDTYKTTDTSLSIALQRFSDNQEYTIALIAKSDQIDLLDSDYYVTRFVFVTPLPEPTETTPPIIDPTETETPETDEPISPTDPVDPPPTESTDPDETETPETNDPEESEDNQDE